MYHLPADHRFEYERDAQIYESNIRYHWYEAAHICISIILLLPNDHFCNSSIQWEEKNLKLRSLAYEEEMMRNVPKPNTSVDLDASLHITRSSVSFHSISSIYIYIEIKKKNCLFSLNTIENLTQTLQFALWMSKVIFFLCIRIWTQLWKQSWVWKWRMMKQSTEIRDQKPLLGGTE